MYPKPILHSPKPTQSGKDHEEDEFQAYFKYMCNHGHNNLQVDKVGFIVHVTKCWLGADEWVIDPSYDPPN